MLAQGRSFAVAVATVVCLAFIAQGAQPGAPPAASPTSQSPSPTSESPSPKPQAPSPRNVNYDIDVTLDPAARTLTGSEIITWRNTGAIEAYSIRLHLYWNAFRNTNSTFLKQLQVAGITPFADSPESDFGYSDVTALAILRDDGSEIDLKPALRFISPDDQNEDDRSLAAADLPAAVAPGQTLRLRVAWQGRFPRNFDRTGSLGNYFFVSQWFPKLGVFEQGGWTAHQFFANSEFYSDFGRYDVRMTVPSGWVLGATGREQSRTNAPSTTLGAGGSMTTHRYVQDDVHDFAWTTSPDFLDRAQKFEHPGLPPVEMRLLLQPEHESQADRYFAATAAALRYYGEWYGPYTYPAITIVDPPFQSDSGGMEYPTLFTGGTRWLAPRGTNEPEAVTIHEAGHQFWYGMVANNETERAWLDEGLNEFSDSRVQSVAFEPHYLAQYFFGGFIPWQFRDIRLKRATDTNWMNSYRRNGDRDSLATPTFQLWPGSHSVMSYHKTALMLHTLERLHSWDVMQKVLSTFFTRWKFRHPAPEDFFAVLNEVTGQDHTWFVDQVYRSSNTFDYAVERFTSAPISVRGIDTELKLQQVTYRTTVVVRRLEAGLFPVDVMVTFANGEQAREKWDGRGRWQQFTFDRPSRAVSVQIDPERVLLLDTNYTNNSRTLEPARDEAATKWSLRWMIWLQDLLMTYSFLV